MATLLANRKEQEDILARQKDIMSAAGDDFDFDLAPGPAFGLADDAKAADKARALGEMTARLAALATEIAAQETLASKKGVLTPGSAREGTDANLRMIDIGEGIGARALDDLSFDTLAEALISQRQSGAGEAGRPLRIGLDREMLRAIISPTIQPGGGVSPLFPDAAVIAPLYRPLNALDLIDTRPIGQDTLRWVNPDFAGNRAAGTARGGRNEASNVAVFRTTPVETIRVTQPLPMELMDDAPALAAEVMTMLNFDVRNTLQDQVITGNNTSPNLRGYATGLTGTQTSAGDATVNNVQELFNRIVTLTEAGSMVRGIFMRAANIGELFESLRANNSLAALFGGIGTMMGQYGTAGMVINGVPVVPVGDLAANEAIVHGYQGYRIAMRMGAVVEISTEAQFADYAAVMRAVLRAAGAVTLPAASHKYTAFGTFKKD